MCDSSVDHMNTVVWHCQKGVGEWLYPLVSLGSKSIFSLAKWKKTVIMRVWYSDSQVTTSFVLDHMWSRFTGHNYFCSWPHVITIHRSPLFLFLTTCDHDSQVTTIFVLDHMWSLAVSFRCLLPLVMQQSNLMTTVSICVSNWHHVYFTQVWLL